MSALDLDRATRDIAAARRDFESLAERAQACARRDLRSAAALCQAAADLAWHNPTGQFCSDRLEALLLPDTDIGAVDATEPRRVLHVLTTAYPVGGHTRLAWRWIERDQGRQHSVALTRQGAEPIPSFLRAAVSARGGEVVAFDAQGEGLLERARSLTQLAQGYDRVVLHIHPCDAVPLLAFAGPGRRPPVMLMNHADHVFWLGARVVDLVVNFRASGAALCARRRGLDPARSALLPLPIDPAEARIERERARRQLGLEPKQVMLLSMASAYKFSPLPELDFAEMLPDALAQRSDVSLLVVGPSEDDPRWARAAARSGGRLKALGRQTDPERYMAAADLYIDSFPFTSMTSVLEAVSAGSPSLSYYPERFDADTLFADDPALDPETTRARDWPAYLSLLSERLDDGPGRRALGAELGDAVRALHGAGAVWQARLDAAYEAAATSRRAAPSTEAATPRCLDNDQLLSEIHRAAGIRLSLPRVKKSHMRLMSAGERARTFVGLKLRGQGVKLKYLKIEPPPEARRES